jgi:phosphoglycerol transferase MdoB-like AlkP superfamily enzyme
VSFVAISYGIEQFLDECTTLGSNLGTGADVMKQNWIYFLSVVIGAILSYLINQLPGVPDSVKPWLWFPVIGLMLLSVWVGLRLMSGSSAASRSQDVLTNAKGRNIRAKDVSAESASGEPVNQRVVSDLEATEDVDLGNISAKQ